MNAKHIESKFAMMDRNGETELRQPTAEARDPSSQPEGPTVPSERPAQSRISFWETVYYWAMARR